MATRKAGLHKEISAIFDGVPIPKNTGGRSGKGPSGSVIPRSSYVMPTPVEPKPEVQDPNPLLPKPTDAKQSKVNAATKAAEPSWWQQITEQAKTKLSALIATKQGIGTIKQKAMIVLIPALSVVLIFVLIQVFSSPSLKGRGARGSEQANGVGRFNSKNEIDWQIPPLYPTTLRDPMRPALIRAAVGESGKVEVGMLPISGIVYSDYKPSAIIGSQIVSEGDEVLGATVLKINEESIEFEMDGKKWTQKVQR